jgi:putative cofactor-binding repeat protein
MAVLLPEGKQSFTTNGSLPLSGGKVYTYEPGTSTPKDTFTTSAGTVANTNPVILDTRGEATIFWSGAYDVILKTAADVTIWGPIRHDTPEISGAAADVLADLADSSDAAKGDALVAVKRTLSGATATTQHLVNEWRSVIVTVDFGATADGTTDDSSAIQAALNTGAKDIILPPGTYKCNSTLRVNTTGQRIVGYGATITTASKSVSGFWIGYDGAAFDKTDYVTVEGVAFTGAQDGTGSTPSWCIIIEPPTTDPYLLGIGCSGIKIINCRGSAHTGGVAATCADDLHVIGCRFGGMEYLSTLTAGGYGVLLQTCFNSGVYSTNFYGGNGDRHAVYVSADPSRTKDNDNVCKGITLSGLNIDWTGVTAITGFEACVVARGTENLSIMGGTWLGGYGGLDYEGENGNGKNISITGVTMDGQLSTGSERACINFVRTSNSYILTGLSITGCTLTPSGTNMHGIAVQFADAVTITGNTIRNSGGISCLNFSGTITNLKTGDNSLYGSSVTGAIYRFVGTGNSGIQIGRDQISQPGSSKWSFVSTPANLRCDWVRSALIRANSTGSPVIVSDEDSIVASVGTDANGIVATLADYVSDVGTTNAWFGCNNSNIVNAYYRSSASQAVTIGVISASGTPVPSASNSYDVSVFLAH